MLEMPVDYVIDSRRRLILTTYSGKVTADELFEHQRRLASDPEFDSTFSELVDGRQVTTTDGKDDATVARELAKTHLFGPTSRRAFVVVETVYLGLLRRFSIYRELAGGKEDIRVFYDMNEALTWLESPNQPPAG